MLRVQCDCTLDVFPPLLKRLVRQGKNQVDAHVVKAGAVCVLDARSCFVGGVNAAQKLQFVPMERLNADAQPIDAERTVSPELFRVDGPRVCFDRNLGA